MTRRSGRLSAVLLGTAMVLANALTGAVSATADGRTSQLTSQLSARLALLGHVGLNPWSQLGRGPDGPALAGAVPAAPEPGKASELTGVYCTSSANCWAVGLYSSASGAILNEMLHWNGSTWRRVAVPSPGGNADFGVSVLFAIRCSTASDCLAVGAVVNANSTALSQALHWNGKRWSSSAELPTPGGTLSGDINELFDVSCSTRTSCWAVGQYGTSDNLLNQMLHWNGRSWTLVRTPNPGGTSRLDLNTLFSIRCPSANYCLSVGAYGVASTSQTLQNQALIWRGKQWTAVPVPSPAGTGPGDTSELHGLACTSASNCFAVGRTGSFVTPSLIIDQIAHWDGSTWTQLTVPQPGGTSVGGRQELDFAACGSPTNCWAVGNYITPSDEIVTFNQMLHWDGGQWSPVPTPEPAGTESGALSQLSAVRCVTRTNCWAVGVSRQPGEGGVGQILHWDGSMWSAQ